MIMYAEVLVLTVIFIVMMRMMNVRMGRDGCRKAGWIRIGYATLAIVDRLLLHFDLDYFLSPTNGLLPIALEKEGVFGLLSLLRFVRTQESDILLWSMHYFGLVNALLLLLGVAPRLNAFALFINTCSFHNANWMICDGIDTGLAPMARLYNFYLLFLPLHHITIYDGFGFYRKREPKNAQDDTWPMWTVWLWQWQTVLIFFGAMIGKFDGDHWKNGTAMYYVMHCTDECIGFFNPDMLFNRALPSKLMTWSALCIEMLSPFTIWFCGRPRNLTLVAVSMLLFGMDISMTMHTFEWYGVLGWYLFLIQKKQGKDESTPSVHASSKRSRILFLRTILDGSIFTFFLYMAFSMAFPLQVIVDTTPQWVSERAEPLLLWQYESNLRVLPVAYMLGLQQDVWTLYGGEYSGATEKMSTETTLMNGTIVTWRSPNWQDLGRIEHKRLYNHMSYYKHITDCDPDVDGHCIEQENLLEILIDTYYGDVKEEIEAIELWKDIEYPPDPPKNLEWGDPLRQPLIKERWAIMGLEFGDGVNAYYYDDDQNEEEIESTDDFYDHDQNEEEIESPNDHYDDDHYDDDHYYHDQNEEEIESPDDQDEEL